MRSGHGLMVITLSQRSYITAIIGTWTSPRTKWAGADAPVTLTAEVLGSARHGDSAWAMLTARSPSPTSVQSTKLTTGWENVAAVTHLTAEVTELAIFGASAKASTTASLKLIESTLMHTS